MCKKQNFKAIRFIFRLQSMLVLKIKKIQYSFLSIFSSDISQSSHLTQTHLMGEKPCEAVDQVIIPAAKNIQPLQLFPYYYYFQL